FSSRRRHTRFSRDWSSDVCSSDLRNGPARAGSGPTVPTMDGREWHAAYQDRLQDVRDRTARARRALAAVAGTATSRDGAVVITRSEERRVGKVCKSRWITVCTLL